MDSINRLVTFLMENLISVALVAFVLVVMWASIGTDVRQPKKDVGGLSKVVKTQMNTLVPPK